VVDDIGANLTVAEGLLSPYQMIIDCCKGGREAIELAEANTYDIIFMDHMMPGMDGIEAAAAIRAREQNSGTSGEAPLETLEFGPKAQTPKECAKHIPIIALTANAVTGMREMFLSSGFDDFLSKPIETGKLFHIVEKWIPEEKRQ
jgi:CheY-like chemotaxis protein